MKKVLIVDDQKEIRDLLRDKLAGNYEALTASSGKEAIAICLKEMPDLVLLDIAMAEMDGYTTCEKLKAERKTKKIPVMFLTGKDLDPQGILERSSELCAIGAVSKLSTLKELLEKIKEVIGS